MVPLLQIIQNHCGSTGWSDPAFENADVSNLQNDGKYGLMIGNCCQSNKFDANVCFGEKLLGINNKGNCWIYWKYQ